MTSQQLTTVLRTSVAVTLAALVGLTSFFGYTVYRDRQEAIQSTPALRTIDAIKKLVRQQPNNAAYRVRLGEAYAAATQYQDAIKQFNAALKIDEKHAGAYLDLGMVAMITKHEAEAVKYYEKVVELTEGNQMRYSDSRRETALYNLGNMAYEDKEYERAVGYFKEALRIRKDSSDTYVLLARCYEGLEDIDGAITSIEYALAFDPNFAQANFVAGELYLEKKNYLKASEHIRKAVDAAPDAREPAVLLEKLGTAKSWGDKARAQMAKDGLDALNSIKIARRIDPQSAELGLLHGQILESIDKNKEALTTYKEALKLDSSNDQIKAAIARLEKTKPAKASD